MNELRDSAVTILLVFVITTILLFSVLTARSYKLTEDARATELVADCELWDVLPPSQPVRTLVLACPVAYQFVIFDHEQLLYDRFMGFRP